MKILNKYSFFSLLFLICVIACKQQNPNIAAYEKLIAEGILLNENDTAVAKIGDKVLFSYGFSSGVQDIHYLLTYHCEDSILQHQSYQEFFLADGDVAGGHSEGVHVFTAKQKGLAKVVFYNPYHNADLYHNEAQEQDFERQSVINEFHEVYQLPKMDTTWTEEQIEAANTAWLEKFGEGLDMKADSLLPIHAQKYTLQHEAQILMDSLYSTVLIDKLSEWYEAQRFFINTLSLHPKTELRVCYVQIK